MQLIIFSVHDQKAGAFLPMFLQPNEPMAIRLFTECINSDSHQLGKTPEDYTLFRLGVFNDNTAEIVCEKSPKSLGNGVVFKTAKAIEETEVNK